MNCFRIKLTVLTNQATLCTERGYAPPLKAPSYLIGQNLGNTL